MVQDKTCFYTCTYKPWDKSQLLQVMHTQSSPLLACMVSMTHMHGNNQASLTQQSAQCQVLYSLLPLFLCRNLDFPLPLLLVKNGDAHGLLKRTNLSSEYIHLKIINKKPTRERELRVLGLPMCLAGVTAGRQRRAMTKRATQPQLIFMAFFFFFMKYVWCLLSVFLCVPLS